MAYMLDGKGPYPNKTGEYCGNHLSGSMPLRSSNETRDEADRHQAEWLGRMRFGRPRACKAGTTKEMEARGFVGLYAKEDSPNILGREIDVPTPPELMEPSPDEGN